MQLIRKKKISQLPLLESTTENTYVHVVDSDENYKIEVDKITASLASKTYVDQQDALKVDKVDGKSLSTEDYTTAEKSKVANVPLNTNTELAAKVDKVAGSSLVPDEDIITLQNTSGTNTGDQDLSGLVEKIDYHSLVPDTEIDKLAEYPAFEYLESSYENLTNKTSDIESNKTSVDKYPTTKGVNDWSLLKFPLKGVALDYIALYSRKIATVINGVITAIQDTWDAHNSRVVADSATVKNLDFVKRYYQMCYDNNMFDSIKFAWLGDGGSKFRTSGIYTYFTKIYSMLGGNDASQVTSTNQPYLSGNIAPNEKLGLKNPNGGSSYMTHPTISFGANESWSVTTVLNWNGSPIIGVYFTRLNNNGIGHLGLRANGGLSFFNFRNSLGDYFGSPFISSNLIIGKSYILTFVGLGYSDILIYLNGIYLNKLTNTNKSTQINFNSIGTSNYEGQIKSHIIRSQALTQSQVTAEYNLLRSYIPEIENVTIGTQTWATSNCEIAATPQGNVIAEMQAAGNVEKITNAADREFSSDTGWWNLNRTVIENGVCRFISASIGSWILKANLGLSGKWVKVVFSITNYVSGSVAVSFNSNRSAPFNSNGTFTVYIFADNNNPAIVASTHNTTLDIDNISVQEIGWSGSQELYDAIYAQTTGTVEQKAYAAVKAAAMWRSPNNDVARAAVYGKHYNKFALKLLKMDIAYFNTANPTALWGWHVATRAENTTLATVGGNALKMTGVNYWNTANGTNTSGATILGGGYTASNGTYTDEKVSTLLMCEDDDFARKVVDGSNSVDEVAITTEGGIIRLIKN